MDISYLSKSIWFVWVSGKDISFNFAHKWSVVTKLGRQMLHTITWRSSQRSWDGFSKFTKLGLSSCLRVYMCLFFFSFIYSFIHLKEIFIGNIGKYQKRKSHLFLNERSFALNIMNWILKMIGHREELYVCVC